MRIWKENQEEFKTISGGRRRDMKYHVESHMEGLTLTSLQYLWKRIQVKK